MSANSIIVHCASDKTDFFGHNGHTEGDDLMPGYLDSEEAAAYLRSTKRKLGLLIKHGLLRYAKLGKNHLFRKEWLDNFMEDWSGYDLGTEDKIIFAKSSRSWEERHG